MDSFSGFSKKTLSFFKQLKKNNTKTWFEDHRNDYENFVKKPSCDFVLAMGEKLEKIAPFVNAAPKVNQSLFRLHRDTRFSKDKTPYKTNMGIWFWEGERKRMECSGFYFHIDGDTLMLGVGMYIFPKPLLESYREAVVDDVHGKNLQKVAQKLAKKNYSFKGKHYKRMPRGFDESHKNAPLLLYNGLHSGIEMKIPKEFYSKDLIEFSYTFYKDMSPLHEWLRDTL